MKQQVWLTTVLTLAVALCACKDDLETGRKPVDAGNEAGNQAGNDASTGNSPDAGGGGNIDEFLMCLTTGGASTAECDYSGYLACLADACTAVTAACGAMCESLGACVADAEDVCACPVDTDCQGCLSGMLGTCAGTCTSTLPPCAFENLDDAGVTSDKTCADLLACCNGMTDGADKDACLAQHTMLQANGDTACGVYYEASGCM